VRSVASFVTPDEIGELVVTPKGLRLRDIAEVGYGPPERTRYDRYNGRPSMVMAIVKESQANTVEVCERIKAAVEEAAAHPDLQGVSVQKVFVQGDTIKYSLDQVVTSGIQGGAIALVVLLFFLRRLRLTIVIALSIPLSLFLAVPVMYFTGQTINLVSLVGLMICVGMVVDNSIVVAENIVRYRRRGLGPFAAALQGAGEIALASTLATATTVIVFLPASLLSEGPTQFFMVRMVTPVCVSLAASLFVALVLVPMASTRILDDAVPPSWPRLRRLESACKRALEIAYDRTMGACNRVYARLLRLSLRRRMDVVLMVLVAVGSTAVPFMNVRCASGSNFGTRRIQVNYSMPSDTTLEDADAFFRDLEGFLENAASAYRVTGQYIGFDANKGDVQIFFQPPSPDEPPFEEFSRDLVEQLPTRPGWRKSSQFGESDGAKDDTFRVAVYGDDHDEVADARDRLEAAMLEIPGVLGVRGTGEDTRRRDELALSVERTMSERFGVPAGAVANTVAYAIRGTPLPRFHTDEREVDVRIRYRPEDREDVDQILGWQVMGRDGRAVPLQVLADKRVTRGEAQLRRHNKRVGAVVMLDLDRNDRPATVKRIAEFMKGYPLPEGLSFDADAEQRQVDDMARDLFGALALGSIFVFLVMGFLFESFVLPLSVMPSIPLSFIGVWWTLFVTRESIDPLAGIGIVLLIGVVVNNAIVLVDFVNSARASGMSRDDALVQAGRLRFRPIMMTSLTTIGGLLPLAFTEPTGEGIPYQAFGKALVGGMATATVLTLLVVPIAYAYLDDLREAMRAWWARLFRRR
jgi:HAE1 family hydrophobic/amphiphilic exporter-1